MLLVVTRAVVAIAIALTVTSCSSASGAKATASDAGPAVAVPEPATAPPPPTSPSSAVSDPLLAGEPLPPSNSPDLALRGRHLLEAIGRDDPALATDIVFPRDAFIATRDHTDAGKMYDRKFMPTFTRDLHKLKRRVSEKAQFTSLEIGHSAIQTLPKKKEFKRTVWRVKNSKLSFIQDGKPQRIEIAELTSWRGAWYVTRLR